MGSRSESDDSSDGVEDDCVVDVVVQQVDAIAIVFVLVAVAQFFCVAGGGGLPIDSTRLAATGRDHPE